MKQAVETRQPKNITILGTNGTGKTTFVKKLVLNELKKKDSHVLVVVPDDMEWVTLPWVHPRFKHRVSSYVGARKVIYEPGLLEIIDRNFTEGMLVFDDCRAYFKAATDPVLQRILIRRRQKELDIVVVGHGFTQVPPAFFTFTTHYALFKTVDNIDRRKDCIQNFPMMVEAQARINKMAEKDPHYHEVIKV